MTQTDQKSKPIIEGLTPVIDPLQQVESIGLGILHKLAKLAPRVVLETASIAMSLSILWLGALGVLMNRQTVDLKFFKPHYEHWFSGAFSGKSADIQSYKAHWIQERQAIEIRAKHIKVTGQDGLKQDINEIRGEFSLAAKILSRPVLTKLYIDGGALTMARDELGRLQIGLGTPQTFEKVGPLWLSKNQIDTSPSAQIDAITNVSVKSATIYIQDDVNQLSLALKNVDGVFESYDDVVTIRSQGNVWEDGRLSPYRVDIKTNSGRNLFDIKMQITDIYPIDIAPKRGIFSALSDLDAPVDLDLEVQILPETGLSGLQVKMNVGLGKLKTKQTYKQFESAQIEAAYDVHSQAINITEFSVESEPVNGKLSGKIKNIGSAQLGFFKTPIAFELAVDDVRINPGSKYSGPIFLKNSTVNGLVDFAKRTVKFENLNLDFGSFQTDLSFFGKRSEAGKLTALNIDGEILGVVHPKQILNLWPNDVALGGRNWVVKSLQAGDFTNFKIHMALTEEDFRTQIASDDHINISFDASNVDIRYLRQMPWLRNSTGHGVFKGNRYEYTLTGGNVDGLELQKGFVSLPQISPKGGDFTIDLYGSGTAAEMLRVSSFQPLEVATRFGITPEDFGGAGNIHLFIKRPLLEIVDPDTLIYDLTGDFTGVSAPVGIGGNTLNNGNISLHINNKGMEIIGPVNIGKWRGDLDWRKVFNAVPIPANYTLSGVLSRDDLDNLGIGLRRHFGGKIGILLNGQGNGLDVQTADLTADFARAEMNFGDVWSKPLGAKAEMTGRVVFGKQGGGGIENFVITADGLSFKGSINVAKDYRLQNVDITEGFIDGFIDAQIKGKPTPDGVLAINLSGQYLNLSNWVNRAFQTQTSLVSTPMLFTGALEKLSLSDNYQLENATALYSHNGTNVERAELQGETDLGPFIAKISRKDGERTRTIHVDIPNASRAALALLGYSSIKDGVLRIDGKLPPSGEQGGVSGSASLTDFTLVRAPAFTQLLSLASLQGLANTLSGDGLQFNKLEMNFSLEDGVLKVRDGRASGAALGLTGAGNINIAGKTMDFNGVLVPSYTVNSILGDVPLLGDVMVGKKGEGMFALNYTMKGPIKAISVSVNPLSALTPGFLRRIFDVKRDDILGENAQKLIKEQEQKN